MAKGVKVRVLLSLGGTAEGEDSMGPAFLRATCVSDPPWGWVPVSLSPAQPPGCKHAHFTDGHIVAQGLCSGSVQNLV